MCSLIFYMLNICVPLFPVWVQSRGFKTLRKHKRLQAGFERPMEPDGFTPSFMKVRPRFVCTLSLYGRCTWVMFIMSHHVFKYFTTENKNKHFLIRQGMMVPSSFAAWMHCKHLWLCCLMEGLLTRDKGMEVETLDKLLKSKNIPDGQQDSFKTGFAEGFLKSQALTQRKQGKCIHTHNTTEHHTTQ